MRFMPLAFGALCIIAALIASMTILKQPTVVIKRSGNTPDSVTLGNKRYATVPYYSDTSYFVEKDGSFRMHTTAGFHLK